MDSSSGNIALFPDKQKYAYQTVFIRAEISAIMNVYGRMVAAGMWRDYAIEFAKDTAVFAAYRRASERPEYRLEKCPAMQSKQGQWTLKGEQGQVLKRGHDLSGVLAPLERKLIKLVD